MIERPLEASAIVIGDEILGGFVQDTNSGWLAERLTEHGVTLTRIVTVPDDARDIDEVLQRELARARPRLIVTSGGIGSTPDDLTYAAVAGSLGRDLVEHPVLVRRIEGAVAWTREHGLATDEAFVDHMMQMARIPEGASLLRDTGSFAPGVRVDVDGGAGAGGATIAVLPGVPAQFRRIVSEAIEPDLLAGRGRPHAAAEVPHGYPESVLNRCFDELAERWPDVKIGSYPGSPMLVRLRGRPQEVDAARSHVEAYLEELEAGAGAAIRRAWAERVASAQDRGS